jgi:hypothetical protein
MTGLNDDFALLDPAKEVQEAFDQAVKTNWTIARHSAALSMGASILSGVFGPELKSMQDSGTYANALRDVVIVLWLCHLTPEEVVHINSRLNIDQSIKEAFEWAEAEGISYGTQKYINGVKTLTEIVHGIFTSFYAVNNGAKIKDGVPVKKNTKPPGKSTSRSTRSRSG